MLLSFTNSPRKASPPYFGYDVHRYQNRTFIRDSRPYVVLPDPNAPAGQIGPDTLYIQGSNRQQRRSVWGLQHLSGNNAGGTAALLALQDPNLTIHLTTPNPEQACQATLDCLSKLYQHASSPENFRAPGRAFLKQIKARSLYDLFKQGRAARKPTPQAIRQKPPKTLPTAPDQPLGPVNSAQTPALLSLQNRGQAGPGSHAAFRRFFLKGLRACKEMEQILEEIRRKRLI